MQKKHFEVFNTSVVAVVLWSLAWAMPSRAFGQELARVENVRFDAMNDYIIIYYDLVRGGVGDSLNMEAGRGAQGYKQYVVTLVLRKERDAAFYFAPKYVGGEVGNGIPEGKNRTIRWNVAREFPQGLEGTDYYFEVKAEPFEPSTNITTWVIGGGAALVGGTVLYFLLSKEGPPSSSSSSFPPPPGRPR